MRVALHACCGPCLIEPFDALHAEFGDLVVVFANPNIHPAEEYVRRRETLEAHARRLGVDVVELDDDPTLWATAVADAEDKEGRCRACYRLRAGMVARWAAANGCDAIATTLTVSPYQDAQAIREEASAAAEAAGIDYVDRDFRDRYAEATRRSRELEMYRQNYCGCAPSKQEAEIEREARRAARRAGKP